MLTTQEIKAMRLFRIMAAPNDWFCPVRIKSATNVQGNNYGYMMQRLISQGYLMYNEVGDKAIILRSAE